MNNKKFNFCLLLSFFISLLSFSSIVAAQSPEDAGDSNDHYSMARDLSVYDIWFYSGRNTVEPPFIVIGYCASEKDLPVDIRVSVNKETQLIQFFSSIDGCTSAQIPVEQFRSIRHIGNYKFTAKIDPVDAVLELNEDNNEVSATVPVLEMD